MKILLIAQVAHEINRAYCAALGDGTQATWDDAPDWQKQSTLAGVEMHLANPDATPEESHQSWLEKKLADGWSYGEVKDAEKQEHPCCLPYEELPPEQKAKDYLFRAVVHQLKGIEDAEEAVADFISRMPTSDGKNDPAQQGYESVKYIGSREDWHDRVYHSGLHFEKGQTRAVPAEIARKLLRHADLFEKAETVVVQNEREPDSTDDDTSELLEKGKEQQAKKKEEQQDVQGIYDQIDRMDKAGLIHFAKVNYKQDLSKNKSANQLREQCRQFVDQFGAV